MITKLIGVKITIGILYLPLSGIYLLNVARLLVSQQNEMQTALANTIKRVT